MSQLDAARDIDYSEAVKVTVAHFGDSPRPQFEELKGTNP